MTCADPAALVAEAEVAVFEVRIPDAEAALAAAEAAFGCALVPPDVVARFFVAEGAIAVHGGDTAGAEGRFRTARDLASDPPDPSYGAKIRKVYDGVPRAPVDAQIDVAPRPTGRTTVWVDATEVTVPVAVASGLHLVQVGRDGVQYGEVALAVPGGTLVVNARIAEAAPLPAPGPAPVAAKRPGPNLPILAAAGGALALGSLSAAVSAGARGQIPEADAIAQVDRLRGRQLGFGWGAYALWTGAAVGVGAAFL